MSPAARASLVYEHDDFVIINKPHGISVHREKTQDGVLKHLSHLCLPEKLWLIHRLDKVTSGLLLLAKNEGCARLLSGLFATRQVQKWYIALTHQKPNKKQGTVLGGMQKIRDGKWILTRKDDNLAVTQFVTCSLIPGIRLALLRPITGKTHQLRVALKSLGAPILGDERYGGVESDRTYLHAWAMSFCYRDELIRVTAPPSSGQYFVIDNLEKAADFIDNPWDKRWPVVSHNIMRKIGAVIND